MIKRIIQKIFPVESRRRFADEVFYKRYETWYVNSRQFQISAITFLTAMLYILFSILDKSWASEDVQRLMMNLHLFLIVPSLLLISYLAHRKQCAGRVMLALAVFSIISVSCHVYIAGQLNDSSPFLPEGYLAILWIFIISGLTFKYALVTATISSVILLVSAYLFIEKTSIYIMYVFWIFCSFSFGFLGALIVDRSRKGMFFTQQKLHKLATTDSLTEIYNRNQFNTVLSNQMNNDDRTYIDRTFGLILIDVDHFKMINDTYGHDTGDKVLYETAQVLLKSLRENDSVFRWGGEEFVIIALDIEEQPLIDLSNKIRQIIEKIYFEDVGNITISAGVTLYQHDDSQDSLMNRADKALYKAKDNGRNCIVCA